MNLSKTSFKVINVTGERRSGKTTYAINKAINIFFNKEDSSTLFIVPTRVHKDYITRAIKHKISEHIVKERELGADTVLYGKNGTSLMVTSIEADLDSARGICFDLIINDDCANHPYLGLDIIKSFLNDGGSYIALYKHNKR